MKWSLLWSPIILTRNDHWTTKSKNNHYVWVFKVVTLKKVWKEFMDKTAPKKIQFLNRKLNWDIIIKYSEFYGFRPLLASQ